MDLINFLRVLDRRKWLMLAVISVAMITTFLIVRQTPPIYRVSGQLSTGLIGSNAPLFQSSQISSGGKYETESKIKSLVEEIQSPQVLTLVSYRLMIHDLDPNRTDAFRDPNELRTQFPVTEIETARISFEQHLDSMDLLNPDDRNESKYLEMISEMDYDPSALKNRLLVRRIPGTDLIDVEFIGETPHLAAFVINNLLREFSRYHEASRMARNADAIEAIEDLVQERRTALDQRLTLMPTEEYSKELSEEINLLLKTIDELEEERSEASSRRSEAIVRYETFRVRIDENPVAPYLRLEAESPTPQTPDLLDQASRLLQRYVSGGSRNRQTLDSVDIVSRSLVQRLEEFTNKQLPQAALINQDLVRGQIMAEVDRAIAERWQTVLYHELRNIGAQLTALNVDQTDDLIGLEIAQDEYLNALNRLYEARLGVGSQASGRLSPVAFVQPPDQPEPSQVWFLSVLAGLISLGISVIVIFVMEYIDSSIKYPSRLSPATGLPFLGALNRLQARNLDLVSLFSEASKNQSLETYKQLMRKLRTDMLESPAKTYLFTSTASETGKTSLLVSMAYALSLIGKKVLMIDANFKNNTLTRIIGANATLEKFLNQEIPRRALVSNSIFDGVDVIGCEGGNLSPAEVFKDEPFTELLASLTEDYDFVLIEGSQLNGFSDSRELAKYVEKVIPVFAANLPLAPLDLESTRYLQTLGTKLMGAVLNRVELANLRL